MSQVARHNLPQSVVLICPDPPDGEGEEHDGMEEDELVDER